MKAASRLLRWSPHLSEGSWVRKPERDYRSISDAGTVTTSLRGGVVFASLSLARAASVVQGHPELQNDLSAAELAVRTAKLDCEPT